MFFKIIKPQDIMFDNKNPNIIKIFDFGVSLENIVDHSDKEQSCEQVGNFHECNDCLYYMAPEVIKN